MCSSTANVSCCNLGDQPEYAGMLGAVQLNLDLGYVDMAEAEGITCCANTGKPCATPLDDSNATLAQEAFTAVDRFIEVATRLSCFGQPVAHANEAPQLVDPESKLLQYVANGGCACGGCPAAFCDDGETAAWDYIRWALIPLFLLLLAGSAYCAYRQKARSAANRPLLARHSADSVVMVGDQSSRTSW